MSNINIEISGLSNWINMEKTATLRADESRCVRSHIERELSHLGVEVSSVEINRSGQYQSPAAPYLFPAGSDAPPPPMVTALPDFCDVRLVKRDDAGHPVEFTVWVPLVWNRRFMGTGGGGNRSHHEWLYPEGIVRIMTMPVALRNGFATTATDAGYGHDLRFADWPLNEATRQLDWSLIENWLYRSKHDMAVIAKAVIKAIYGEDPIYSYFQGTSGGGRDALAAAQHHPEDFDGVWASDPAIHWTKLSPAGMWPALVMKESGNPIPPAKFRAFHAAVLKQYPWLDGSTDDGALPERPVEFDASSLVGTPTDAGPITELDASVVQKIWAGPRRADGTALWYGLRPGTESWGDNMLQVGMASTKSVNGRIEPEPFLMSTSYFRTWIFRDPNWDWKSLTIEQYLDLFQKGVDDFASRIDTDNPDLTGLATLGRKLLLSHGAGDGVIFPDGTIDYYNRVVKTMGGVEKTKNFMRFFLSPGDCHSTIEKGPGLTVAGGMAALMRWVEQGEAPDAVEIVAIDLQSGTPGYPRRLPAVEAGR